MSDEIAKARAVLARGPGVAVGARERLARDALGPLLDVLEAAEAAVWEGYDVDKHRALAEALDRALAALREGTHAP